MKNFFGVHRNMTPVVWLTAAVGCGLSGPGALGDKGENPAGTFAVSDRHAKDECDGWPDYSSDHLKPTRRPDVDDYDDVGGAIGGVRRGGEHWDEDWLVMRVRDSWHGLFEPHFSLTSVGGATLCVFPEAVDLAARATSESVVCNSGGRDSIETEYGRLWGCCQQTYDSDPDEEGAYDKFAYLDVSVDVGGATDDSVDFLMLVRSWGRMCDQWILGYQF